MAISKTRLETKMYVIITLLKQLLQQLLILRFLLQILNKRTHQNPKYANVKSTINTGATAKNVSVYSKCEPKKVFLPPQQ